MPRLTSTTPIHRPCCPSLPPELWILIFSFHDPLHLWTTCRQISPSLRSCAESAFAKHFLSSIHISFHLDRFNLGGRAPRPEVPVLFDRLESSEAGSDAHRRDQSIAVFADKRQWDEVVGDEGGKNPAVRYEMIQARWAEVVRGYRAEMPGYTVWMEKSEGPQVACVNDSGLPRLEIDLERREVRVEWASMLSLLFREHKVLEERLTNHTMQEKGQKGSPTWSTNHETALRRIVRRARLKEYYTGDLRMEWAVGCLKYFDPSVDSGNKGTVTLFKMDPDLPGARLGERWFGSNNIVKELFLDEWSCMHRIEGKILELNEK